MTIVIKKGPHDKAFLMGAIAILILAYNSLMTSNFAGDVALRQNQADVYIEGLAAITNQQKTLIDAQEARIKEQADDIDALTFRIEALEADKKGVCEKRDEGDF